MKNSKKILSLTLILSSVFVISGCSFSSDTKPNNVADKKVVKEDFLPKSSIVSFYFEPSDISDVKKGDDIHVNLMMNTNEEKIVSFDSVVNYYKLRLSLKNVKINPSLKENINLDDTKEGYVSIKALDLNSDLVGETKLAELTFSAKETGRAFFDISKGSLSAVNQAGDNVADVENLQKVNFQIAEVVEGGE